jgi:hypothetical protein
MTKKEWLLSTDGVVRALQYDMKEKGFGAKIEYQKNKSTGLLCETMSVTDDWVINTPMEKMLPGSSWIMQSIRNPLNR